jgi:hypothetical protein
MKKPFIRMKRLAILASVVLSVSGCDLFNYLLSSDTVTSHYDTLASARSDNLFARGWLPDILPESSINIRTSNDLDVNTSTGSFEFSPSDANHFYKLLTPGLPKNIEYKRLKAAGQRYTSDGYTVWSHEPWVFICHSAKGRCIYYML